jgi:uncharacterized membrane protein
VELPRRFRVVTPRGVTKKTYHTFKNIVRIFYVIKRYFFALSQKIFDLESVSAIAQDSAMNFLEVLMQWIHIGSVAVAVGGMFTLRFVGCPAIKSVLPSDEDARKRLMQAIIKRFKIVVHASVTLLLVSGGYLLWAMWPVLKASKAYRHGMETKILLALAIFFLSIMLTATREQPNFFQKNRDKWLTVNIVLAMIVIGIASYLRRMQ